MIKDEAKHFLYRHIRQDTGIPFYVGIGTKSGGSSRERLYRRAYSDHNRTKHWFSVKRKCGIEVEILLESDDYEFIKQKEIEFIALYGRQDNSTGILVNHTNGGDGLCGYKHPPESIERLRRDYKAPTAKKCTHFDTQMEFNSLKEGCEFFGLKASQQSCAIRERATTAQFFYVEAPFERRTREDVSKYLGSLRIGNTNCIGYPVVDRVTNTVYPTLAEACRQLGLKKATELSRLKNNRESRRFNHALIHKD